MCNLIQLAEFLGVSLASDKKMREEAQELLGENLNAELVDPFFVPTEV